MSVSPLFNTPKVETLPPSNADNKIQPPTVNNPLPGGGDFIRIDENSWDIAK
ncbi:MAG: hypothetical protein K2X66_10720 [Cyanobacteria bacterium]|nr:hypothetical protein [Cyanobacteriota bacterium]